MEIGKVPESVLKRSIINPLTVKREEVLYGPNIGEDCSVLKFNQDDLMVLSCDPITGATKDIGTLAIHVTANDIAASGGEMVGVLLSILLPENSIEDDLKIIMKQVNEVCETLNIQVLGGHTEVTAAVNQVIITVTGIGKATEASLTMSCELKPGMDLVMTKWAGIEGTSILANEKEEALKGHVNQFLIEEAKSYGKWLSVVPEAAVAVKHGVRAMHDITEGGVLGALWEMAASSDVGFEVALDAISVKRATIEICEHFNLNPYQLISSGAMLMAIEDSSLLLKALEEEGIHASLIGKVTAGKERLIISEQIRRTLKPPKTDELYKVLSSTSDL